MFGQLNTCRRRIRNERDGRVLARTRQVCRCRLFTFFSIFVFLFTGSTCLAGTMKWKTTASVAAWSLRFDHMPTASISFSNARLNRLLLRSRRRSLHSTHQHRVHPLFVVPPLESHANGTFEMSKMKIKFQLKSCSLSNRTRTAIKPTKAT